MKQETECQMSEAEYRHQVVAEFDAQVRQILCGVVDVSALPAPHIVARNAAHQLSVRNHFDEHAGPFYDIATVRQILGVSRQAIADRARHHRILRLVTTDDVTVFPAFQFVDGTVDRRLIPVLQSLLGAGASGWTVALWLTAGVDALDGMTPVEALRSRRADLTATVAELAAEDAERWAA
jgi:hypothetical protein